LLNLIDTHPEITNIYVRELIDAKKNSDEAMYDSNGRRVLFNTPGNIFKRLDELENLESIALGMERPPSLADDQGHSELSDDDWDCFTNLKGLKSICLLSIFTLIQDIIIDH
jgi:hypothetical protein